MSIFQISAVGLSEADPTAEIVETASARGHFLEAAFSVWTVRVLGLWPAVAGAAWRSALGWLHTGLVTTLYIIVLATTLASLFVWDSLTELTDNVNLAAVTVNNGAKERASVQLVPWLLRRRRAARCLAALDVASEALRVAAKGPGGAGEDGAPARRSFLERRRRRARTLTITFFYSGMATCVGWTLAPALAGVRMLPFPGWFPYDTSASPAYELTYLLQAVATNVDSAIACLGNTFYAALSFHACTQTRALGASLRALREDAEARVVASREAREEAYGDAVRREMDLGLRRCIRHHQALLRYVEELNAVSGFTMLVECLGMTLLLCSVTFHVSTLQPGSVKFLAVLGFLFYEMLELLAFCWFSSELSAQSTALMDAAYACGWEYRAGSSDSNDRRAARAFSSSLRLLMLRVQTPLRVRTLGGAVLSLDLFTALMRASYSYYTMLTEMGDE